MRHYTRRNSIITIIAIVHGELRSEFNQGPLCVTVLTCTI